MNHEKRRELIVNSCIFVGIMALTMWSVLRNQDFGAMADSVQKMSLTAIALSVLLALLFVAGEGTMIWYSFERVGEKSSVLRCISYSFIGFFFSGITPSATGGQPMQLYYMKKDRHSLPTATVILMTIAIIYKFVLVLIGIGILFFWREPLMTYLQGYFGLYLAGLLLNVIVTGGLLMIMFLPGISRSFFYKTEQILIHFKIWKQSETRREKAEQFLENYQNTVYFLKTHKKMIGVLIVGTFVQRCCVFVLTYVVYKGLHLAGTAGEDVLLLQASVYIAVDMLPIPGAQGITEAMYKTVYAGVFPGQMLMASMCITRGISFYFVMAVSFAVFCAQYWCRRIKNNSLD